MLRIYGLSLSAEVIARRMALAASAARSSQNAALSADSPPRRVRPLWRFSPSVGRNREVLQPSLGERHPPPIQALQPNRQLVRRFPTTVAPTPLWQKRI